MVKKINLKKVFALVAIMALSIVSLPTNIVEASDVSLSLSNTSFTITNGQSITVDASYSCINGVKVIALNPNSVILPAGLSANVAVTENGLNIRTITLTNVTGNVGTYTVNIPSGTGRSASATDGRANAVSFTVKIVAANAPTLALSNPNPQTVNEGSTVTFTATYSADTEVIALNPNSVQLSAGLTANVSVTGSGNTRTITLTNVKGNATGNYITIPSGTGRNSNLVNGRTNAVTSGVFSVNPKQEAKAPVLTLSNPNPQTVKEGGTVTFTATYSDDTTIIALNENSIQLSDGLTANVKVTGSGKTRTITLTNVKGKVEGNTITIPSGTGRNNNATNGRTNGVVSAAFKVVKDEVKPEPTPTPVVKPTPKPSDWRENPNTGI